MYLFLSGATYFVSNIVVYMDLNFSCLITGEARASGEKGENT